MKKLKEILFLSDKGYTDLKKAIIACTITNLAMLLPFCITVMVFSELLNPFLGQELDWQNIWLLCTPSKDCGRCRPDISNGKWKNS